MLRSGRRRQRATGQLDVAGSFAAVALLVWTDRDTSVAPRPAAMVGGANVAVDPGGIPVALRVMAVGKVGAPMGVTTRAYVAALPGLTSTLLAEPVLRAMLNHAVIVIV